MVEQHEDVIQNWVRKAKEGDETAYTRLLEQFKPAIDSNIKTTVIPGYDKADLRQEYDVSLVEAVQSFDPDLGNKFITHLFNTLFYNKNGLIKRHERDKRKIVAHATVSIDAPVYREGEGAVTPEYEDRNSLIAFDEIMVEDALFEFLNKTENDVANLIIQGYKVEQIAKELDLSKNEVQKIKKRIETKIKVSRKIE